jgi:hypothetical protein
MGPLLVTGFTVLGATIAIGLIASRTPPPPPAAVPPIATRTLGLILVAIAGGIGVLGVVVGLLAVEIGRIPIETNRPLMIAPAFAGAALGLAMALRPTVDVDRMLRVMAIGFITSLASLAAVIAFLSTVFNDIGSEPAPDVPFVVLGIVAAMAAIGLGWVGTSDMGSLAESSPEASLPIVSRQIRRVVPLQFIGVAAAATAIVLLVAAPT